MQWYEIIKKSFDGTDCERKWDPVLMLCTRTGSFRLSRKFAESDLCLRTLCGPPSNVESRASVHPYGAYGGYAGAWAHILRFGGLKPWKYVGGVRVCFDPLPKKMSHSFIHSKLLLDNSASFTSSRVKDLCQKMEGKTNFFEEPETVWWLDLTDSDPPYFTTDLRRWGYVRGGLQSSEPS